MAALSALVFALSWWMGLYLASRDPRKPVLVLAAVGLCGFAAVVAIDAIRVAGPAAAEALGRLPETTQQALRTAVVEDLGCHDCQDGRGGFVLPARTLIAVARRPV